MEGGHTGDPEYSRLDDVTMENIYETLKNSNHANEDIVFQNVMTVVRSDSLFYTSIIVGGKLTLGAMLDSGSMACTMSVAAKSKLVDAELLSADCVCDADVMLVGCGGARVKPKCAYNVEMEVNGCQMVVLTLVVDGQSSDLILGTNVLRHVFHETKKCDSYWTVVSSPCPRDDPESEQFLSMLAGFSRRKSDVIPDKIGTVRSNSAVFLDPGREFLVWGRLSKTCIVSPGSTVMTEPTASRSAPRHILVSRVVTPMWVDGWIPLKLINVSDHPVSVKWNAKLANVFLCVALEDIDGVGHGRVVGPPVELSHMTTSEVSHCHNLNQLDGRLCEAGLSGVEVL